ncbi:lipase secretion chaperone [Pseudoalteromonas umbrosa]|uniref:lipase secretion chaperone n=1 Tax=Pseudoalteromonas umbrosa TaxID=3048489 RepID=UPI0024C37D90|nr:lipase secretion chaperone [Pseudoalteromonas sp. B95]MDK1285914.1 lipase secretion chaperone [Pseudoalteromonas sp. B95]
MKGKYLLTVTITGALCALGLWYFNTNTQSAEQIVLHYPSVQKLTVQKPRTSATTEVPVSSNPISICSTVTKSHKAYIDDWLIKLQHKQQVENWPQFIEQLPVCLQSLAHDYMHYKVALTKVDPLLNMHERFEALTSLQKQYFSQQVINAWFQDENSWHAHTLTRWHILSDKTLSDDMRKSLLEAHISQLSDAQRQIIESSQRFFELKNNWHAMDHNQFSVNFGDEAALRLVALQSKQQLWQQKIKHYKQARQTIVAQAPLEQHNERIKTLKHNLFDSNELKRLDVILSREQAQSP